MGAASFAQSNFLGGEWSEAFSGRVDHPNYKKAMKKCRNAYPGVEGNLVRRPGFNFIATTRSGGQASLTKFEFANDIPYNVELSDTHMRFFNGQSLVFNDDSVNVSAISTATPAVATIASDKGWVAGTQIKFFFDGPTYPDVCATLRNRVFTVVARLTATTYSLEDNVTGVDLDGSTVNFDAAHVTVTARSVLDVTTPWTGTTWQNTRLIQEPNANVFLNPDVKPYSLVLTPNASNSAVATATLAFANMLDGPYLDIDTTGAFLKPILLNAAHPNIVSFYIDFPAWDTNISYNVGQLVVTGGGAYRSLVDDNLGHNPAASPTYWETVDAGVINGAAGFTSADIGRCVRVLSEPPEWDVATTYAVGDAVLYDGLYYTSLVDPNLGATPGADVASWIPTTDTNVARWCWGRITATDTGLNPRFTIEVIGDQLIYVSAVAGPICQTFRLGLYGGGGGNGWPTCGVFHEGRMWLGGAVPNRFDASKSNEFFNFAPTGPDGTVADNNAIAETFNSKEVNQIHWMETSSQGILCGTKTSEWMISASALSDPLSPTNIQAKEVTHYGTANMQPVKAGISTIFVQRYQRKILEFLSDGITGKYSAPDLTAAAKHFTTGMIDQIAYQEELAPVIWLRITGGLYGVTYQRTSPFVTDAPSFAAWHRTVPGGNLLFESITVGPANSASATIDVLSAVVQDTDSANDHRHVMTQVVPMDENSSMYDMHFLDDAVVPGNCLVTTSGGVSGIRIYGLWHLNGQTVTVMACGLDCGDYAVSGGTCFVPFGSDAAGLFTLAFAQSFNTLTADFPHVISRLSAGSGAAAYYFPLVVGHTYTTECQTLRPDAPEDTGARNGPGFAKLRRIHQFALQCYNVITGTIEFGVQDTNRTVASTLRPVAFKTQGNTAYTTIQPFTGIHRGTLDDDYNYDSMLYWRVTRPFPMNINRVGAFIHTQDA